jgi:hypothetical protein
MAAQKRAKWSRDASLLRWELNDLRWFRDYRRVLYWAMNHHPGLTEEDGGLIIQSIIRVYEQHSALLIRRITKSNDRAGGASLLWLMRDLSANHGLATSVVPGLPAEAEIAADADALEVLVKPVNDLADVAYAHVDRAPAFEPMEAYTNREPAIDLTLLLGRKYLALFGEDVSDDEHRPSEREMREVFGQRWLGPDDPIPAHLLAGGPPEPDRGEN